MTQERNGGHAPPAFNSIDEATPGTSRGGEGASGTSDDYTTCLLLHLEAQSQRPIPMPDPRIPDQCINDVWKVLHSRTDANDDNGHANSTGSGSTGFTAVYSSGGGCDDSVASTSHAGMQEASGMSGNETRNATGAGGGGHQELSGVSGNVWSCRDALHGHDN
ncbi:uncharacterized protein [Dermacentor albipictus]|uniref:uncharacterized protein isoform X1 n=1 Tax=Dermacentor albipictus TaxID=60249 RepID=UPI0038FBFBCC